MKPVDGRVCFISSQIENTIISLKSRLIKQINIAKNIEEKYIVFAVDQTIKIYDVFIDEPCGLIHQSRGFMVDNVTILHDHW